jgi:hypothetical protein
LRVKPFVKFINYQHMMPTRYNLDVTESLAKIIPDDGLTEQEKKKTIRKAVKETLETRYKNIASGKNEKVTQGVQFFFRCVFVRVFWWMLAKEGVARCVSGPSFMLILYRCRRKLRF